MDELPFHITAAISGASLIVIFTFFLGPLLCRDRGHIGVGDVY